MCTTKGTALTEREFRERASVFAHDRLVQRQRSTAAVLGPDMRPVPAKQIDPQSWEVSMSNYQWRAKRHLTRDLWQVVECDADGSSACDSVELGPAPARIN
jgi:hypothetical protein